MKKRFRTGLIVAMLMGLSIVTAGAQKNKQAEAMMAAAQQKETVEGDLNAAIKQYKEIADKYAKTDRSTAAMALVRMADALRRKGDAESRKVFDRVLTEYSDQKEAVTLAQRLGGEPPAGAVSRTVWTPAVTSGGSHWGTLSPDGRFFSYSTDQFRQSGDVFIHEIATGVDRNITNRPKDSRDGPSESAISPDGKKVAYVWWLQQTNRYTLRVANLSGEPKPLVLYDNPDVYDLFFHGWSPDGKSLAVVLHHVDRTTIQIGLISVSDGSLRVLKTVDWRGGVGSMYFSPDGKYLGYDRPQSDASGDVADVFLLAVDGSREAPGVVHPSNDAMRGWSPDGKLLLFSSDRSGTTDLWAVSVIDGKPQGQPRRLRANVGTSFRPIGWTPSGALYYETKEGGVATSRTQLASLDFAVGRFSSTPVGTRGYQENTRLPKWSLDGKKLAYQSELRDRGGSEVLQIHDTETGATQEVKLNKLNVFGIEAWTPDGSSLFVQAFGPADINDHRGIYRLDVKTGVASNVALSPKGNFLNSFAFSVNAVLPDGLSFLTSFDGPNGRGIYRVDMQTGNLMAVVLEGTSFRLNGGPTPSLDGRSIYYRRVALPSNEVALIERDLATGKEVELIQRSFLGNIHLSPDGQYIATAGSDPSSNSRFILLIPTAGGEVRELMRVPSEIDAADLNKINQGQVIGIVRGGWAPDSRSLLVRIDPSDKTKDVELWRVSLDGSSPERINGNGIPSRAEIFASPDGRHFVYTITEPAPPATSEVAVLENFLPKAEKQ